MSKPLTRARSLAMLAVIAIVSACSSPAASGGGGSASQGTKQYTIGYSNGGGVAKPAAEPPAPGQTALFNSFEDAIECNRCGGRMVRAGTCYTCRDCGTSTGCG